MKLLILSDLHLEFAPLDIPGTDVDVVILAGDIHIGTAAIEWINAQFAGLPVIYVPGNHEYYRNEFQSVRQALLAENGQNPRLHVLDRQSVRIADVTFYGATLWTDLALYGEDDAPRACKDVGRGLSDFNGLIKVNDAGMLRNFTVEDSENEHKLARTWLTSELSCPTTTKRVVISHHLPSQESVAPRYRGDRLSPGFASNLDELLGQVDLWIHGHTHDSFDYMHGNCRVVCNPRGYVLPGRPPENPLFNPALVITL